jgi:hypothetical protein
MKKDFTVQVQIRARLEQTIRADSFEDALEKANALGISFAHWQRDNGALRSGVETVDHNITLTKVESNEEEWP